MCYSKGMKTLLVNILCVTQSTLKGQSLFFRFFILLGLLTLPGCITSKHSSAPLAPQPPEFDISRYENDHKVAITPQYFADPTGLVSIEPMSSAIMQSEGMLAALAYNDQKEPPKVKNCRLKDRFDRKVLLAYEWDRNRMTFDMSGIGSSSDMGMRVEYKLRLQPEKSPKEKCRFNSSWQGLIGSGYNELMLREDDTVLEEIKGIRSEVDEYLNILF